MTEPLWTRAEIAAALDLAPGGRPFDATGVSIDTRTLEPGDLFVALSGRRDGAAFAAEAFAKGAAGAVVGEGAAATDPGKGPEAMALGPVLTVPDPLDALRRLGAAARDRAEARRCAVTGSVGKTSVTQAIAAALRLAGPSHSSVRSYNNHIGVPLTLARMPRETRFAVFELGMNHAEEIRPLSRLVQPHVAVVTTVGSAHVENFPDGEGGVARAKAEIFDGLRRGGAAVLNADNPWFDLLRQAAKARGAVVLSFGRTAESHARLISLRPLSGGSATQGMVAEAELDGRPLSFTMAQTGPHWGMNSLAVVLATQALGLGLECALEALAGFAPLPGRGQTLRLSVGEADITLVDESYNANPLSVRAVLLALADRPASGRKIVVLTDMLELGASAPQAHAELAGPVAASGAALVFAAGPLMRHLFEQLPSAMQGAWRADAEALATEVLHAVRPGDLVLVKGSNGSRASTVVDAFLSAAGSRAGAAAQETL